MRTARTAVLAPPSGGCVRYLLSAEVAFAIDASGRLCVAYPPEGEAGHLVASSSMSLRILAGRTADGMETGHLVLTGDLAPMDRAPVDLWSRAGVGAQAFVFRPRFAHLEIATGGIRTVDMHRLLDGL